MFSRSPAVVVAVGTAIALAAMVGALYLLNPPGALEIYCAAAMIKPMQAIKAEFEAETGQRVLFHPGASQVILTQLESSNEGDLFLPADESYVKLAQEKGLVGDVKDVANMRAVLIVRQGYDKEIKTWSDFLAVGQRIGLANPGATAIGSLTKRELEARGLWEDLAKVGPTYLGEVNEVGNSVANTGSTDVGITWDALAKALADKNPKLKIVNLKELDGVKARVQIAVVQSTKQRDNARRFMAFLLDKDKGLKRLKEAGYDVVH